MLLNLVVENFVLLDKLELDFSSGLSVITGETGAGKSLIIDAIQGIIGGRLSPEQIKINCKSSYLEATFAMTEVVKKLLTDNEFDVLEENLTLSRTITRSGSKCRINGQLVSLAFLKLIGDNLIDIIGQNENQYLFKTEKHRQIIDSLGSLEHKKLLESVQALAKKISLVKKEYDELEKNSKENQRQLDFFKFQLTEIDEVKLKIGEDEELKLEREKLVHAEDLSKNLSEAYHELYSSDEMPSICDRLNSVSRLISDCSKYDPDLEPVNNELENLIVQLEEVARTIRNSSENIEANPEYLEEVETRLNLVMKMKNKYGSSIEDILKYREELSEKVDIVENSEEKLVSLKKQIGTLEKEYKVLALKLSEARKVLAEEVEPKVERELADLGMDKAKFKVGITVNNDSFSENGLDSLEFLLSSNPGEPLRSLSKTASGGEISRITLALRMVLQQSGNIASLIFDEIDTGISGKAALTVSQKLANLAQSFQILCITHLPVVAAMADKHLWIEKNYTDNSTSVTITMLNANQRIEKLAQMSGGKISENSLKYSNDIYENASAYKKNIKAEKIC